MEAEGLRDESILCLTEIQTLTLWVCLPVGGVEGRQLLPGIPSFPGQKNHPLGNVCPGILALRPHCVSFHRTH